MTAFYLTDLQYETLRHNLSQYAGLDYPPPRRAALEKALTQVLQTASNDTTGPARLPAAINITEPKLLSQLAIQLTVGESHIFRHQAQFEQIAALLPPLAETRLREAEKSGAQPVFQCWSAGCARGEEAVSLAILLAQHLPPVAEWAVRILGTDLNPGFVQHAQTGLYRDWAFREPAAVKAKERYFQADGSSFRLKPNLRAQCEFRRHNLLQPLARNVPGRGPFDLILCRNVIIYFSPEATTTVVGHLRDQLRPGGYLFFSPAESGPGWPGLAQQQQNKLVFYRCVDNTRQQRVESGPAPPTQPAPRPESLPPGLAAFEQTLRANQLNEAARMLDRTEILALTADIRAKAHLQLGQAYADQGNTDAAEHHCRQALAADPLLAAAHYTLAQLHLAQSRLAEAVEAFRATLYLEPKHLLAQFQLGLTLYRQQDYAAAHATLTRCRRQLQTYPPTQRISAAEGWSVQRLHHEIDRLLSRMPPGEW